MSLVFFLHPVRRKTQPTVSLFFEQPSYSSFLPPSGLPSSSSNRIFHLLYSHAKIKKGQIPPFLLHPKLKTLFCFFLYHVVSHHPVNPPNLYFDSPLHLTVIIHVFALKLRRHSGPWNPKLSPII